MKSNLAYIDDTIERHIEQEAKSPTLPDSVRADVKDRAYKVIAGFRLHDEAAEKKLLDEQIKQRRDQIKTFRDDRTKARTALEKVGVTPLAVVPTTAWVEICMRAKLFLLMPDKDGRIPIPVAAFKDYTAKEIEFAWQKDRVGLLTQFFPGGKTASTHGAILANLILPTPPADVAEILVKAADMSLKVVAVADAINFAETPTELLNRSKEKDAKPGKPFRGFKSHQEWMEKCPIIFTEQGTATAIIAQFGDFPIEQAVVDAVVASDKLLPEKEAPVTEMQVEDVGRHYQRMISEAMAQRHSRIGTFGIDWVRL